MLHISNFTNQILFNIDFRLYEGENLIILGSNGAGKSTLAKVACGIIESECVEIFGHNISTLSAKQRSQYIHYIAPKLEIYDEYISMEEFLHLSRLYSELSVKESIELLELQGLEGKSCKTLSSGEQQLTLLASSLLHHARLTIFDEPTANLDPQKTLKVYKLLKSDLLKNKIIITHDLNLAHKLGYKILYIQDGKIAFFDENEKFFSPSTLKHFFGESLKKIENYFVVNL